MKTNRVFFFRFLSIAFFAVISAQLQSAHASQIVKSQRAIVSLSPAATEWIYALGLGERLVGVTEQCDFPREALSVAKVGSFMNSSVERILSLGATDVVSTESLPTLLKKKLDRARIRVHIFAPDRLDGFPRGIELLGAQLDSRNRGVELAREFATALKLERMNRDIKSNLGKSSLIFVSAQPVFVASPHTWLSDVFVLAGFSNSFPVAMSNVAFPRVSIESLARIPSEYWFVFSDRLRDEQEFLASYDRLKKKLGSRYAKAKTVVLPADIFQRPGPRLKDAFLLLRRKLK